MISLLWLFSTVAFYAYFTALLRLILSLFFRDISLKSQELLLYFSSHFNEFFLFNLFRWNASFSCPFYLVDLFVYLFVIIRLFIRIFLYFGFSISLFLFLILSSCLAVLIYLFILYSLFLLNCANSVLCAV